MHLIKKINFVFMLLLLFCISYSQNQSKNPVDYVNPLIGTDGRHQTEYGGMQPAVTPPFGMTHWVPVTRQNRISKNSYHYADKYISGFIGTHQPAIWMGDYGQMSLMPGIGDIKIAFHERKYKFSHKNETTTPAYYSVILNQTENHWIDVDRVKNNKSAITDRKITQLETDRIRLYISEAQDPQSSNSAARIYEFELYSKSGKIDLEKFSNIKASGFVVKNESPQKAVDGNPSTKWCAAGNGNWIEFKLNKKYKITRWRVKHAEAGKENPLYNTSDFSLQIYQPEPKQLNKKLDIKSEMTATTRCSIMKFSFPEDETPHFIIDASYKDDQKANGWIYIDKKKNEIRGWNSDRQSAHLGNKLPNFRGYFVIKFNQSFQDFGTYINKRITAKQSNARGNRVGGYVKFGSTNKPVLVKIGTSFISLDQARKNLDKEISDWNFDKIRLKLKDQWNSRLSRIIVEGQDDNAKSIFYTGMYHAHLYPRIFSEYGKYYSAFDDRIHHGVSYNDYSLWDTFRALHPLLTLTASEHVGPMISSLLQMYNEGGWLPKWPNPSYTGIMIGTHSESIIADALVKGIDNFDINLAYEACYKSAMIPQINDTEKDWADRAKNGSIPEIRGGLTFYKKLGYVPADKVKESVSRTLEFAYGDFCIAQIAKKIGKTDDYNYFISRSKNYKNVYKDGFVVLRNSKTDFLELDGRKGFTEGNPWTYQFCVMQDMLGLVEFLGGNEKFARILDQNFENKHYRHDNEPGHHYAYLYNYCKMPWKTQKLVRQVIKENYQNAPKGYSGNEDCGQMSAWYIFSSMGFYPVTPGSEIYAIGSPMWDRVKIKIDKPYKQNEFKLIAYNQSSKNIYIQSMKLNGKPLLVPFIKHSDIINGGTLEITLGPAPGS